MKLESAEGGANRIEHTLAVSRRQNVEAATKGRKSRQETCVVEAVEAVKNLVPECGVRFEDGRADDEGAPQSGSPRGCGRRVIGALVEH